MLGPIAASLAVLLLGVIRASIHRDWNAGVRAIILAGPAAVAWLWYAWYEATMPAHMNIRIDLALVWPLLVGVSLASGLYAFTLLIEGLFGVFSQIPKLPRLAAALWHSTDRCPASRRSASQNDG